MNKEKNWQPQHRTSSHPGLLSSVGEKGSDSWESVTHSAYVPQKYDTKCSVGARTKLMEEFYWQEFTEQAYQEYVKPHPVEEYVSEYGGEYHINDFQPSTEKISNNSELHRKYPLYADTSLSYWQQLQGNAPGTTKIVHPNQSFRRNGQFSKPLADILDEPPVGFQS